MTGFWIASILLGLAVGGVFLLAARRGAALARQAAEPGAAHDLQVYRDQLAEIDRDAARGTVADDEAARLRNEIKRRILDADRAARAGGTPLRAEGRAARLAGAALIVVMVAGAFGIYLTLGAPDYPDRPLAVRLAEAEEYRATRPTQAEAEADRATEMAAVRDRARAGADPEFLELIAQLRTALTERPDDLEGHVLLARNEAQLGDFAAAHRVQARVIELLGDDVGPGDRAMRLDLMVRAAGGYVSPEAEAVIDRILAQDPANGLARYYAGLLEAQVGRPDRAFRMWRALLERSQPDAPWVPPIRGQIEDLARVAGERYVLPEEGSAPLRGPSAEAVEG